MKLVIGLGNPGKKYEKTRHNIGQAAVKKLAEDFDFPNFKLVKKTRARIAKKQDVILALLVTYMNESGQAMKSLLKFLSKSDFDRGPNIIVIHDDLDIPLGKIKICQNRSAAGHKGVQSIIEHLKTRDFTRIRIGIKPRENLNIPLEKFVLKRFSKKEKKPVEEAIGLTIQAVSTILQKGIDQAMSEYNN